METRSALTKVTKVTGRCRLCRLASSPPFLPRPAGWDAGSKAEFGMRSAESPAEPRTASREPRRGSRRNVETLRRSDGPERSQGEDVEFAETCRGFLSQPRQGSRNLRDLEAPDAGRAQHDPVVGRLPPNRILGQDNEMERVNKNETLLGRIQCPSSRLNRPSDC